MSNKARQNILGLLTYVQNRNAYINQDIMTFAGFLKNEELAVYVRANARRITLAEQIELVALARSMNAEG